MNTEPNPTDRMPFQPVGDTKEARALHTLCSTPNRAGRRALDKVQGGAPHRGACARWTPRNPVSPSVHAPGFDLVVLTAGNGARNAAKRERRARRGVS
jgi:hypothetical protein